MPLQHSASYFQGSTSDLSHVKGSCANSMEAKLSNKSISSTRGCSISSKVSKVFRLPSRVRQSGGRDEPWRASVGQVVLSSGLLKWGTLGGRAVLIP